MKKVIALLLVGTLLTVSLCGCSKVRDFMAGTWLDELFSEATDTKDTGSGNGPLVPADTTAKDTTPGVGNWGEDTGSTDAGSTDTGSSDTVNNGIEPLLKLGDKQINAGYILNSSMRKGFFCYYIDSLEPGKYILKWDINSAVGYNTSPYIPYLTIGDDIFPAFVLDDDYDGVMDGYSVFNTNDLSVEGLCDGSEGAEIIIREKGDVCAFFLFEFDYNTQTDIDTEVAEAKTFVKSIEIYRSTST